MALNRLFLVLPIANDNAMDEERAYLDVLDPATKPQKFVEILKNVVTAFSWTKGEEFVLYYDHTRFQDLYKKCPAEVQEQRPSPVQLLGILSQMTKIPEKMPIINANFVPLGFGVLYGYVNLKGEVLVDHKALVNRDYLNVKDKDSNSVKLEIIDCERREVVKWFVKNRNPKRAIDANYAKHGSQEKGEDKEVISGRSYTDDEYQAMLHWAVGNPDCRRKYFMDKKRGRLVIFWDENLKTPTYHYYDVDINDAGEIAKMRQDCDGELVKQIEGVSAIMQE